MTDTWYRHRVVKHKLVRGVRFAEEPGVAEAMKELHRLAEGEMSIYTRSHYPGQILKTEFVGQRMEGLEVFVALTLFGPPDMKKEILQELAERGEV